MKTIAQQFIIEFDQSTPIWEWAGDNNWLDNIKRASIHPPATLIVFKDYSSIIENGGWPTVYSREQYDNGTVRKACNECGLEI